MKDNNEKTRTFIFAIITFLICASAFVIKINKIVNGTFECNAWQIFSFVCITIGMIVGAKKIINNTN